MHGKKRDYGQHPKPAKQPKRQTKSFCAKNCRKITPLSAKLFGAASAKKIFRVETSLLGS
jgi:hypothetical protein